jgi:hypothetical protein
MCKTLAYSSYCFFLYGLRLLGGFGIKLIYLGQHIIY